MPLKLLSITTNSIIKGLNKGLDKSIEINIDENIPDKNRMYINSKKNACYYLYLDRDIEFLDDCNNILNIMNILNDKVPAILVINDDVKIYHRSVIHYFFQTIPYQKYKLSEINYVLTLLEEPFKPFIIYYDGKTILGEHNIYSTPLTNWEKGITEGNPIHWINRAIKFSKNIPITINVKNNPQTANFFKFVNINAYFNTEHKYFKKRKIHFKYGREMYGEIGLFHFAHDFQNASRNRIVNHLITSQNYRSYLEIGVFNCYHFDEVIVQHKIGVDPKPQFSNEVYQKWAKNIVLLESDAFFKQLEPNVKFDLIFIDGCLMEDNVLRDIYNALEHLTDDGIVLMHDCNPPNEFYQRDNISGSYKKNKKEKIIWNGVEYIDKYWNGKTWKAIAKMRMTDENLSINVVDTDWGMGVIRKGNSCLFKLDNVEPDNIKYDTLIKYRHQLLNLISVEEFLQMYPY